MRGKKSKGYTLDLFAGDDDPVRQHPEIEWPDPARFPLNRDTCDVEEFVWKDLKFSQAPILVVGFASLDRIINFISDCRDDAAVRVIFGFELFASRKDDFSLRDSTFNKEMETYWLERGISLRLSAKLIYCIERLKSRKVLTRYMVGSSHRLHAKIYVGDEAATIGSSNFTEPGLKHQLEANARFENKGNSKRYDELKQIAENYWELGRDYNDELIALLERLLRVVPWREALARACAELLEGEWAQAYLRGEYLPDEANLWPSQRQGIAQALYILSNQGSVLVADATGSGKTRMGVHLVGAVADQILRSGRIRHGKSLMVCPPIVGDSWQLESHLAGVHLDTYSHGVLSQARSRKHELTIEALRRAQILCVDEGHNFLNLGSTRTQNLLRNMADHVMLFTATPINRSVIDLLRIADMLGADNLDDSTLDMFNKLLKLKHINRTLDVDEVNKLKSEIARFTVRRTKKMLNQLIDRDPELYLDKNGKQCRFPKHKSKVYKLREGKKDRELASEIREVAGKLYAATHFQKPIEMPLTMVKRGVTEEKFLEGRLKSAKTIAGYLVMSSLRSSRAALAEHIVGTKQAKLDFNLPKFTKNTETGNVLGIINKIAGRPPRNKLSIDLPDWLTDEASHRAACEHDLAIYQKIYELLLQMSEQREKEKARFLAGLLKTNSLLLAFDSRPITLADIEKHIMLKNPKQTILVASGDTGSQRSDLLVKFSLDSQEKNIIGLCSDSLSEGVNLQKASAMVHLDMPSVVRIAEQRVGRVDRLDSPHSAIEVWWPDDAPEFALSSDEKFIERYDTVEALLGANMPLPEHMQTQRRENIKTENLIKEFEEEIEKSEWSGIQDAFQPVREIVQGDTALIDEETYEHYRHVTAKVLSRVSLVKSNSSWAFFCLRSGNFGAPRWVLLPNSMGQAVNGLEKVSLALRERLTDDVEDLKMDENAGEILNRFLNSLATAEKSLLPRKKQRALHEMELFMCEARKKTIEGLDQVDVNHLHEIYEMLTKPNPYRQPDWDEVAARWLDLIRPIWFDRLSSQRTRPLLLKDIRPDLKSKSEEIVEKVLAEFRQFPILPSPDERISACIIGVG